MGFISLCSWFPPGLKRDFLVFLSEAGEYLHNLSIEPKSLTPEDLRYGYVSANMFFNLFHAGFCAPYIQNPNYMLLVDFRTKEEYNDGHLLTAIHYESFTWDMIEYPGMKKKDF